MCPADAQTDIEISIITLNGKDCLVPENDKVIQKIAYKSTHSGELCGKAIKFEFMMESCENQEKIGGEGRFSKEIYPFCSKVSDVKEPNYYYYELRFASAEFCICSNPLVCQPSILIHIIDSFSNLEDAQTYFDNFILHTKRRILRV